MNAGTKQRTLRVVLIALVLIGVAAAPSTSAAVAARWRVVAAPNDHDCELVDLSRVPGAQVIWAVDRCLGAGELSQRWTAKTGWRDIPTVPIVADLNGVAAAAADDVWTVGQTFSSRPLVEHWDGTTWTRTPTPDPNRSGLPDGVLLDVVAISPQDVWAVGSRAGGATSKTLVEHWDGTHWSVVHSPNQGPRGNQLYAVSTVPGHPGRLWAFGYHVGSHREARPLILHYRHGTWRAVTDLPDVGDAVLYGGVATGRPGGVWAVGEGRRLNGLILRRTRRHGWRRIANPFQKTWTLDDITTIPGTHQLWAVGNAERHPLALRWRRGAWREVPTQDGVGGVGFLYAVIAFGPQSAWAGGADDGDNDNQLIERYR
jgi:hypothetical protein